jgi:DNA repair protein RecO (recombination protein O)
MPAVRTPSLILHSFAYGDTSRILRLLTPELGLRSVIAKGAMSPKGRFGGLLEPFTEGEAQFNLRPGRDLLTLSGFSLIRSRQSIGRNLGSFTGASLVAEVILRFSTEEANPELYDTVVSAFDRFAADGHDPTGDSLAILWNLIALFGFRPEMTNCVHCGSPIGERDTSRFDPDAGGVACLHCRPVGRTVPPQVRAEIGCMCSTPEYQPTSQERRLHSALLHAFLAAHLFQGQPLRSLPLFLEQFR